MDVPETYGQVVHRLPFRAAAKAGIITDYKVIISVVTSDMVTDEALRRGIVLVEGDEIKARQKTPNIWDQMFAKLLKYREIHGDCNVPQRWDEDKELGRWVNTQRIHYRRGDIPDADRIQKLEAIGFEWNTRRNKKRK
jgi:hypothetical protein